QTCALPICDPAPQAGNPALWVKPDPWRIRTICLKLKIRSDVILERTRHLPRRTFFSVTFYFGRFRPKLRTRAGQICGLNSRMPKLHLQNIRWGLNSKIQVPSIYGL